MPLLLLAASAAGLIVVAISLLAVMANHADPQLPPPEYPINCRTTYVPLSARTRYDERTNWGPH